MRDNIIGKWYTVRIYDHETQQHIPVGDKSPAFEFHSTDVVDYAKRVNGTWKKDYSKFTYRERGGTIILSTGNPLTSYRIKEHNRFQMTLQGATETLYLER